MLYDRGYIIQILRVDRYANREDLWRIIWDSKKLCSIYPSDRAAIVLKTSQCALKSTLMTVMMSSLFLHGSLAIGRSCCRGGCRLGGHFSLRIDGRGRRFDYLLRFDDKRAEDGARSCSTSLARRS
jgi:hypothetical protein